MSQLDILLPFALPPPELAADLLRECKTPALAMLLARAKSAQAESFDPFSRALPHETWLARQCRVQNALCDASSPPLAAAAMQAFGLPASDGWWFLLNPVHFHVARDHLVLTDRHQLDLSENESQALFASAQALFEEAGKHLLYGDRHHWFVRADDWQALLTSSPDAACGHNIDIWMPKGPNELSWRKLQNEVQMVWHADPVNAAREARGAKPVNSVWLWGGAPGAWQAAPSPYREVFTRPDWMRVFGTIDARHIEATSATAVIQAAPEHGLLMRDDLLVPALAGDWGHWLQQLHVLEETWFAPMLAALQAKKLESILFILSHNTRLSEIQVTSRSLQKFWIKPSLARLLP